MKTFALTCILFTMVAAVRSFRPRIVGGQPAADHEFPALASLQVNGSHYCGVNVLNSQWLLTAAHCVYGKHLDSMTVLAGTNSQTNGGFLHAVEQIFVHENYTGMVGSYGDLALVKVSPQLTVDDVTISTVTLPAQGQTTEDQAAGIVAGWGYLSNEYGNDTLAPWLQKLDVTVINNVQCQKDYKFNLILDGHICAGNPQAGRGICGGDSGGALLVEDQVVGLVSFSRYCGGIHPPAVYTRVSFFVEWIQERIQ